MRSLIKSVLYAIRSCLPRDRGALVLAYHSVDSYDDEYTVSKETFEWQLDEISRQGLRIITLPELDVMLKAGHVEDRTVVLTFDDGRRDNFTNLFPIIRARKIPITIFSITGDIGNARIFSDREIPMLTESDMHEMHDSDLVDFQPHTVTHPKLTQVALDYAHKQIAESKLFLETMLGKSCKYFAYPYGRHSNEIEQVVREAGITLAVATHAGFVTADSSRFAIPRNHIRHDVTPHQFKSILNRGSLR